MQRETHVLTSLSIRQIDFFLSPRRRLRVAAVTVAVRTMAYPKRTSRRKPLNHHDRDQYHLDYRFGLIIQLIRLSKPVRQ